MNSQKQLGLLTLDNLEEAVTKSRQATASMRTDLLIPGDAFVHAKRTVMPFVTLPEFKNLCDGLGGGFFWGDTTMIAAINSGGKTVLATQLADCFIKDGYRVAMFTTELRPDELFVRAVCNRLEIKIERMTKIDSVDPLKPTEVAYIPEWLWRDPKLSVELEQMRTEYRERMLYADWSRGEGMSALSNFEPTMTTVERRGFDPHVIIFDWIGGGIDELKDPDKLRHYYSATANLLINHGKRTNRIMITCAQLDKTKVSGKTSFVNQSMIAESRAMSNNMKNFIGITTMADTQPRPGENAVHRFQHLCLAKATRGHTGRSIPVETKFEYQKFVEKKGLVAN